MTAEKSKDNLWSTFVTEQEPVKSSVTIASSKGSDGCIFSQEGRLVPSELQMEIGGILLYFGRVYNQGRYAMLPLSRTEVPGKW